jgi:DNA ligase-1|tara:strand:+ start:1253 stop:2089 length:837 start_codon:yes stop_codon:yes gene_type:complete
MIQPMLAHKVDQTKVDYTKPVFMQPKLDGVRCVIAIEDNQVIARSRTGKQWLNIQHVTESLQQFFASNPDTVLDGELYNHDLRNDFEKIISLVRKQKPTSDDRIEAAKLVQFHCYDYISNDDFSTRRQKLQTMPIYSNCVLFVDTMFVVTQADSVKLHTKNLAQGYEGSILRLNAPYECKRSRNLQKFKDFHDTEATIVDFVEGKGKRSGTLGKFIMCDADGITFGCPPGKGYNYANLRDILININDYIGKTATFTYFERTKANSYRHPMFKTIRDYE